MTLIHYFISPYNNKSTTVVCSGVGKVTRVVSHANGDYNLGLSAHYRITGSLDPDWIISTTTGWIAVKCCTIPIQKTCDTVKQTECDHFLIIIDINSIENSTKIASLICIICLFWILYRQHVETGPTKDWGMFQTPVWNIPQVNRLNGNRC